ncbi:MAG: hypothetical protein U0938_05135 [Thiobacillus sp.]|nr:hypothetical protein [Thiobacillus sp.]
MSLAALDNLARIGQIKPEPRNEAEVRRMQAMAQTRLNDARLDNLSPEGRFTSAYNAAHAAALAALRWHGYRSENRHTVFQCLEYTLGWPAARWRVLDAAHRKRNLAEHEGFLEVEESDIAELCALVSDLIDDAARLTNAITRQP